MTDTNYFPLFSNASNPSGYCKLVSYKNCTKIGQQYLSAKPTTLSHRATNTHFFIELLKHEAVYSKNIHIFLNRQHFYKQRQAELCKKLNKS